MEISSYQLLANAIVEQAALDYQAALCGIQDGNYSIEECERFFNGEYIKLLTKVDGPALMNALKQKVKEDNYKLNKPKRPSIADDVKFGI